MSQRKPLLVRFHRWRLRTLSEQQFILILSILIGVIGGIAATIIKNTVRLTQKLIHNIISQEVHNYIYFVLPIIGIFITVVIIKYLIKSPVRHGIPNVLHSISQRGGKLSNHNMYSSVVTSALTVGFGGSVGLEGPTVATGAAYGSYLSRFFRLNYKQTTLMLSCASAAAMAAIFKAPIAAIVFAVEVIMVDLTTFSLVPLLLASASAVLTSFFFMGQNVLYPFEVKSSFMLKELPYYIILGVFAGLISAYYSMIYTSVGNFFDSLKDAKKRLFFGGISLGALIFIFPSLFGEGYESINAFLKGDMSDLFNNSLFYTLKDEIWAMIVLLALVMFLKIVAVALTFGSGGIGGIFAPTLFTGVTLGMLFAQLVGILGLGDLNNSNFALVGMSGLIAGVLHAPLTGIFLIADISGGYSLFVPLMITSTISYVTVRAFTSNSVYHIQLARRKELMTHDQDMNVLRMMQVKKLIETDFETLNPDASLRDLTEAISRAHRNLFPVVDDEGNLKGMVKMQDVRHLIFKHELYDIVQVADLMYWPEHFISPDDTMELVAHKFEKSGRYNLAVIDKGKYVGFISKANVFSIYRKTMAHFSHE